MITYGGLFRIVAWATVGWFFVLLVARNLVFGVLGISGAFFVNTFLMGALAILAGPILLHHLRNYPHGGRERGEWTGAELFYAVVFFIALFIFLSSVAYLGLSG